MSNNKIYINNLSKSVTEDKLHKYFANHGEISEIHLPIDDKRNTPKGYAFITFAEPEFAESALKQDGETFLEKPLTVQLALEKPTGKKSPK